MNEKNVPVFVRLVIRDKGNILLARIKGADFYFFPGGGLEFDESVEDAIARELKEELGMELKSCVFIGANENRFTDKDGDHHGIDLAFAVEVDRVHNEGKEEHLTFELKKIDELPSLNVLPKSLRDNIVRWMRDGKIFWGNG